MPENHTGRGLATSKRGRYLIVSTIKLIIAIVVGVAVQAVQYGIAAFGFCLFIDATMPPQE